MCIATVLGGALHIERLPAVLFKTAHLSVDICTYLNLLGAYCLLLWVAR